MGSAASIRCWEALRRGSVRGGSAGVACAVIAGVAAAGGAPLITRGRHMLAPFKLHLCQPTILLLLVPNGCKSAVTKGSNSGFIDLPHLLLRAF